MEKQFTVPLPEGKNAAGAMEAVCRYLEAIHAICKIEHQEAHWCILAAFTPRHEIGMKIRLYQQDDQLCVEITPFTHKGHLLLLLPPLFHAYTAMISTHTHKIQTAVVEYLQS